MWVHRRHRGHPELPRWKGPGVQRERLVWLETRGRRLRIRRSARALLQRHFRAWQEGKRNLPHHLGRCVSKQCSLAPIDMFVSISFLSRKLFRAHEESEDEIHFCVFKRDFGGRTARLNRNLFSTKVIECISMHLHTETHLPDKISIIFYILLSHFYSLKCFAGGSFPVYCDMDAGGECACLSSPFSIPLLPTFSHSLPYYCPDLPTFCVSSLHKQKKKWRTLNRLTPLDEENTMPRQYCTRRIGTRTSRNVVKENWSWSLKQNAILKNIKNEVFTSGKSFASLNLCSLFVCVFVCLFVAGQQWSVDQWIVQVFLHEHQWGACTRNFTTT